MTTSTAPAAITPMTAPTVSRVNFFKAVPKAFKALNGFDLAANEGLDPGLVELIHIRASQINQCGYCVQAHAADACKAGESEERLHVLPVWREARALFTEREQAALALTEAVTLIAEHRVPDDVYAQVAAHFDEVELARLIASICVINTWNRIAISTGMTAEASA
ncbi:carboxymuconolactone decarboxylase family protein [Streptomyces sp. NPDC001941]|uniref:carboxymuconolactone decarboxylase family protein n=1 Tax=Streptomyces sp. NPDC001941 TaxID=3154659 RepID=UPI00332AB472